MRPAIGIPIGVTSSKDARKLTRCARPPDSFVVHCRANDGTHPLEHVIDPQRMGIAGRHQRDDLAHPQMNERRLQHPADPSGSHCDGR
jgi:hypothetical protein